MGLTHATFPSLPPKQPLFNTLLEQQLVLDRFPEYQRQAGAYNTLLHRDYENLHLLYEIVRDRPADWSHAWPKLGPGRIDFHGKIRTCMNHTLTFKKDPSGLATYKIGGLSDQGEMDRPPEWADKKQELRIYYTNRGQWVPFTLRQRLSPEAANDLMGAGGGEAVTFDFSSVHLIASTTTPDEIEGQPWQVMLPKEWIEEGPTMIP
jgi:hypothetical protein